MSLRPYNPLRRTCSNICTEHRTELGAHFFAVASQLMRRILVDHARGRAAEKRGGGASHVALDDVAVVSSEPDLNLVALDNVLERLAALDPQQARIVEVRFFGGLTIDEAAAVVGISPATVKREWATAKAWLYQQVRR
ncbi:MAG: ECF-type sigma factor [Thermoanaerobaculia bacterium]